MQLTKLREALGSVGGWLLAPGVAAMTFVRRARMFHPRGIPLRADVVPVATGGAAGTLAVRLAGPALVRFSTAWWKNDREWIDALGCSIRFRENDVVTPRPDPGDQDLLFATIRHPWTTPFAPLTTNVHDFLANHYYAVAPFDLPAIGRGFLRLTAIAIASIAWVAPQSAGAVSKRRTESTVPPRRTVKTIALVVRSRSTTTRKRESTRALRLAQLIADSAAGRSVPPLTRPGKKK